MAKLSATSTDVRSFAVLSGTYETFQVPVFRVVPFKYSLATSSPQSLVDQVAQFFAAELKTPLSAEHLRAAESEADDLERIERMRDRQMQTFRR